ncbi:MAG: nitrous oxide reductase accessory protein NosL, partial [Flavobacteriaceae bacterium]
MKCKQILSVLLYCLIFTVVAQNQKTCVQCNMIIKDNLHNSQAKINEKIFSFDAIECMLNYMSINEYASFTSIQVSDYLTGEFINAEKATYLISKAIPSPMGANLSAFKSKEDAERIKKENGGEIFLWENIKLKLSKVTHSHHNHYRPDAHAPIGIMGDHLHEKGGLMLSFRYMNMAMKGNKSGTDDISNDAIYIDYMVAPQQMTMDMFMFGVMYAPSDKITLM